MNTLATNTYSSFLDHTVTSLDMLEIRDSCRERKERPPSIRHQSQVIYFKPSPLGAAGASTRNPSLLSSTQKGREMMQPSSKVNHFFKKSFWLYHDSQKPPEWWTLRYSWAVNAIWKASPHICFPLPLFHFLAHVSAQFDQNQSLIRCLEPILPAL